jgi:hypothetical protein
MGGLYLFLFPVLGLVAGFLRVGRGGSRVDVGKEEQI